MVCTILYETIQTNLAYISVFLVETLSVLRTPSSTMSRFAASKDASAILTCGKGNCSPIPVIYLASVVSGENIYFGEIFVKKYF